MLTKLSFSFCKSKPHLYIFAGQGTQQKGMLNNLLAVPQAKKEMQSICKQLGHDLIQIATSDSNNIISKTKITQPLLVASQVLHFRYKIPSMPTKTPVLPLTNHDFMVGHSIGQYSALCLAESISLLECVKLVAKRGQLMEQFTHEPSGMLIVRFSDENEGKVRSIVDRNKLEIACFNSENNVNIAGGIKMLQEARKDFRESKITCLFLPVSAAFHCKTLQKMKQPFREYLQKIKFSKPKAKILRNLDTKIYENDNDIKQGLIEHLTNPVQFWQSISKIDPQIECIQIGHKENVKKFVDQIRKKNKSKNPSQK